jgi:hypothetical protein
MNQERQFIHFFDADLSHRHETNQQAAKERGWTYDVRRRVYIDGEGCIVADRFGQRI